jgi:hypothetical protein
MRVMRAYAVTRRFARGMEDAVNEAVGGSAWLGIDSSMDGSSDEGESVGSDALREELVSLRHENLDRRNFLNAAASLVRR